MEDSNGNESGFHTRAAALLNNQTFSDLEIHVKDGNSQKIFLAHKLFLAMGSHEFADIFYGSTVSPRSIKIFDYKPQTVYLMLQYLYTSKLNLSGTEEARELYTLSKKFGIRILQELCVNYISNEELNKDNVLPMYECALREKFMGLLKRCQNVVSCNTKAVFESPYFVDASVTVVEDILQLENLEVESELDILNAAVRWAQYECKKRKLPDDFTSLRKCMYSLFRHIRFLTLKVEQFCDFVEKYNILTSHESSIITRKLLQPQHPFSLPEYLCASTIERSPLCCGEPDFKTVKTPVLSKERRKLEVNTSHSKISSQLVRGSIPPNCGKYTSHVCENNVNNFSAKPDLKMVKTPILSKEQRKLEVNKSHSKNSSQLVPALTPSDSVKCSSPVQSLCENNVNKPISEVPPQLAKLQKGVFEFPLKEMKKLFSTAFNNDVKCAVSLNPRKGAIFVHGLELKITQLNEEEFIKVYLNVSMSGRNSIKSADFDEKLNEGVVVLTLDQPVEVLENNTAEIEVTIEDLKLNRCNVIKNSVCELIHGSDILACVAPTSNQMNETGEYFFLINRLFYSAV